MEDIKNFEPLWGNWYVKELLGEGGYGKVYRIERVEYGVKYEAALKHIRLPQSKSELKSIMMDGMDDATITSYFEGFIGDIIKEFALMSKLKGNSHIVSYEDHIIEKAEDEPRWDIFIRMELLTSFVDYITGRKITNRDIIKLGIDICKALETCQKYNIIHRDIKPENIFVSDEGQFKLGDFGIARQIEKTVSGLSKKGTYTYIAPEVYRGEAYGSSVDTYSLGLVMYRLLNYNRMPFMPPYPQPISHNDREMAFALRVSGKELPRPAGKDDILSEIVLKACAYNPKDRYSSPTDMRRSLEAILYEESEANLVYLEGDTLAINKAVYVSDSNQDSFQQDDFKTRPLTYNNIPAQGAIPQAYGTPDVNAMEKMTPSGNAFNTLEAPVASADTGFNTSAGKPTASAGFDFDATATATMAPVNDYDRIRTMGMPISSEGNQGAPAPVSPSAQGNTGSIGNMGSTGNSTGNVSSSSSSSASKVNMGGLEEAQGNASMYHKKNNIKKKLLTIIAPVAAVCVIIAFVAGSSGGGNKSDTSSSIPSSGYEDSEEGSSISGYDSEGAENILEDSGMVTDSINYEYKDRTLSIYGSGAMPEYNVFDEYYPPWNEYGKFVEKLVIGEGVTTIGSNAFWNFYILKEVTIPQSVTTIGDDAFIFCSELTSINIPDSVTSIGRLAFAGCDKLSDVTLPSNTTVSIGESAFGCCEDYTLSDGNFVISGEGLMFDYEIFSVIDSKRTSLYMNERPWEDEKDQIRTVVVLAGITHIGNCAFKDCTNLFSLVLPTTVKVIGCEAFKNCTGLTEVSIPPGTTTIDENAFYGCTGLTSVVIPSSVTEIYDNAFYGCTSLQSVIIPEGVTTIGKSAFGNCTNLSQVTLPNSLTYIGDNAFSMCDIESVTIPNSGTTLGDYVFDGKTTVNR